MARKKALSGTAKAHRKEQESSLHRVARGVQTAAHKLDLGDCTKAADALLSTAASWGAYNAHTKETSTTSVGANRLSNEYFDLKRRFRSTCLVKK